jgi:hypothetical protein
LVLQALLGNTRRTHLPGTGVNGKRNGCTSEAAATEAIQGSNGGAVAFVPFHVVESAYAVLLDLGVKLKLTTNERLAAMQVS